MSTHKGPRERHPSGRPIKQDNKRSYADGARNQDGPRTARLRQQQNNTNAIGFLARIVADVRDEQ